MRKGAKPQRSGTLKSYFLKSSYISILSSIVLISLLTSLLMNVSARRHANTTSRQELDSIVQNTGHVVQSLEAFIIDFAFHSEVQRQLRQYNQAEAPNRFQTKLAVDQYWRIYANSLGTEVSNAAVFALNGDLVGSLEWFEENANITQYPWYPQALASTGEMLWLPGTTDPNNRQGERQLIPVVKKIRSINVNIGMDLGYLLVYFNAETLLDNVVADHYPAPERSVFLLDGAGNMLAHTMPDITGGHSFQQPEDQGSVVRYDGRQYLYYGASLPRAGWQVRILTDMALLMKDSDLVLWICLLFSLTLMGVFLLISIHNAKSITRPFSQMQKSFAQVEKGLFNEAEVDSRAGIAELDDLVGRYNLMVQRLESLIYENYESKLREQALVSQMQEIKIEALQLQVNPHFLYNTLDSINWMALQAGNQGISKMVLALGSFFRSNMSTEVFTTVEKEMKSVSHFLYIQKVRFDEKLEYEFQVEEECLHRKTLRMLLQPLVENSIKHGVTASPTPCLLKIMVRREGDSLVMEVADDGVGMKPDTLEHLRRQWEGIASLNPGECKVGLINIMKRLQLCYRGAARFGVDSAQGKGTTVRVEIPCE